jgi:hypothetical protein
MHRPSAAVLADRLVVLKREDQGGSKGMGSDMHYHNTFTFTPRP